jgi:hypothetical protein
MCHAIGARSMPGGPWTRTIHRRSRVWYVSSDAANVTFFACIFARGCATTQGCARDAQRIARRAYAVAMWPMASCLLQAAARLPGDLPGRSKGRPMVTLKTLITNEDA